MIQIGNQIVSLDILEKEFCCDLTKCNGVCCIEGDAGAPITDQEIADYENNLEQILPYLPSKNQEVLKSKGVYYLDDEGEKVTMLVDNAECAFVEHKGDLLLCGIEQAYRDGKISVQKPISCHLYPIRCHQYHDFEALNYDKWTICSDAICKGKKEHLKVYQFLKEPLIRKYGEDWYNELCEIAKQWEEQKKNAEK
ncbi:MAG: DUF3109 family protein [Bacteroidales bacterium]|nr:DUF3109 family protein [Bacteroidales bacterium]